MMTTRSTIRPSRPAGMRAALAALLLAVAAGPAQGQAKASAPAAGATPAGAQGALDAHRREDVARHRAISVAHEAAARCLESGQKESACHDALRKACEGIAVGRYCGMKHSH